MPARYLLYLVVAASAGVMVSSGFWWLVTPNENKMSTILWPVAGAALASASVALLLSVLATKALLARLADDLTRRLSLNGEHPPLTINSPPAGSELVAVADRAANTYIDTLKRVLTVGDAVALGAAEISYFLDQLRQTIAHNLAHARSICQSTEDMTQSTGAAAQAAAEIADTIVEARTYSDEGLVAIDLVNQQLQTLKASAERSSNDAHALSDLAAKIQNITQVIDNVAEQTNLLALNAAIEAARAGEHGRGFAVVADEVRALAHKTTASTTEIGQMLDEIKQQTETSANTLDALESGVSEVVNKSDSAKHIFGQIHSNTVVTASRIHDISDTLKSHATTMSEISNAVVEMSQQMAQTGQHTEEVSQEATRVSDTGEHLNTEMSKYTLGTEHERFRQLVIDAAARVTQKFEQDIAAGEISESALFDRDYQPIAGTQPQKYHTQFDAYTDRVLPPIQEPLVNQDTNILFAGAVDNNGYFPTHNKRYSQPLTGNCEIDIANNRTKRIFNDRTGARCGSNTEKFLLQTYKRDTGEIVHDVSAPIYVKGRHWGGFRMGYKSAHRP